MENTPEQQSREEILTLNDLRDKRFMSLKIGETKEFTVKKLKKCKVDEGFALSGDNVDFRYEIDTEEGETLTISAWELWKVIRKVLNDAGKIEGVKLRVAHLGQKQYTAEVIA